MGRWGWEIYDSDAGLGFLDTITDFLEREFAFWMIPEQRIGMDVTLWLSNTLPVLEIMLLLKEYHPAAYHIRDPKTVQRWRGEFLSVWDSDWQDTVKNLSLFVGVYGDNVFRKQHRSFITAIFDHFESTAHSWGDDAEPEIEIPLPLEYTLPFFSVRHRTNQNGESIIIVEQFIYQLIENLEREIIYRLSLEKRAHLYSYDEIWIAVDLVAFLCESYQISARVNQPVVRKWRDTMIEIWEEQEARELYQNVMRAFDRLESVAQKHPPMFQ